MILTNVFRSNRTALSHWISNRVARLPAHSLLIVPPLVLTCGVVAVLAPRAHVIAALSAGTAAALLVAGLADGRPDGLRVLAGVPIACGVLCTVGLAVPNATFNQKPAAIPNDGFDTFCSATDLPTLVPRAPFRSSPFLQRPGR